MSTPIAPKLLPLVAALVACRLALAAPGGDEERPVLFGTAGDFIAGMEGMLSRMGLPHERIFQWEITSPEPLQRYHAILYSGVNAHTPQVPQLLEQYARAGGHVHFEMWVQPDRTLLGAWPLVGTPTNFEIVAPDHPLARGMKQGDLFGDPYLHTLSLPVSSSVPQTVIARFTARGSPDGAAWGPMLRNGPQPALQLLPLGAGEFLFAGGPVGFPIGWRSPALEPVAINVLRYLGGPRCSPRFVLEREPLQWPDQEDRPRPQPAADPYAALPTGSAPTGWTALPEPPEIASYNLSFVAEFGQKTTSPVPVLIFDNAAAAERYELRLAPRSAAIARASNGKSAVLWQGSFPARDRARFILRRRPNRVDLLLNGTRLASVPAAPARGRGHCFRSNVPGVRLSEVSAQPVVPPDFADDFMREPNEASPWETLSGTWQATGIPNPDFSVNAFCYRGTGGGSEATPPTSPGWATTGYWFWEGCAASVSVRPLDDRVAVGLAVNVAPPSDQHDPPDCILFRLTNAASAHPTAELVRLVGDQRTVLAHRPIGAMRDQWYRLSVHQHGGMLRAYVDGQRLLEAPDTSTGAGKVALYVENGSALLDDAAVTAASEAPGENARPASGEGSPRPAWPANVGPTDYQTWACRAAEWVCQPDRPTLFWHRGRWFHDVRLSYRLPPKVEQPSEIALLLEAPASPDDGASLRLRRTPDGQATVTWRALGRQQERAVQLPAVGQPPWLTIARRGAEITARLGDQELFRSSTSDRGARLGIEVLGDPIRVSDLLLENPTLRDYTFSTAPTDWWSTGGDWGIVSRWSCDDRWSWFAGSSSGTAAIWNKRRFEGDLVFDYYVGLKHKGPGGDETERSRDLNVVVCGDGKGVDSGYSFIWGDQNGRETQLRRQGQVVARAPGVYVPRGYEPHHNWFHLTVRKLGGHLGICFENRPLVEYDDPQPLSGGYLGVWTQNSAICLPRATIYAEREAPGDLLSLRPPS